ncbi:(Fe-S)-binding protein [Dictyobacter arantiisoli]|uniref:Glycolate oxidase iron-sulfur subunit n=1 Tax=Dictyobacter arantiisoli TaxID=2014874 RepID=A0A5A5TG97_9CHLR|nr:heterodisulfide reductase-related iron-sulfur binding cluster [Dictyobacter arantiisoli]GCF10387.1 glycolate oxidase iron-sulfur subunit [Dictyobacter arantiisoli]
MNSEQLHNLPLEFIAPDEGPLRRHTHTYNLMRQCIHCGFCLPTCPTYAVLGVEMDSPRGRIYQMQAVAEGKLDISEDFVEHMNCCIGCRACETACPSGVQFGKLIEAAREQIQLITIPMPTTEKINASSGFEDAEEQRFSARRAKNSRSSKLLKLFFFKSMLPSHTVLSIVFGGLKIYQQSGLQKFTRGTGLLNRINNLPTPFQGQLKLPEELMDSARGKIIHTSLPVTTPALGTQRYQVGMISGCIMDQVFHDINEATIRVLAANGCKVITPRQQNCCGALHIHSGEAEQGRELARRNIDTFEQYNCDAIIINSAGCGSTLKEYAHLLRDDPKCAQRAERFSARVKDISEFLLDIGYQQPKGEIQQTVTYHDACHLLHGQKIKQQPRQLLKSIPGIVLVDLKESDWCCGSAGIYNLTNQQMAQELLERKIANIETTRASIIATGNPGCMMQIAMGARQRGLQLKVMHPVELLDEAYKAEGVYLFSHNDTVTKKTPKPVIAICTGFTMLAVALLLRYRRQRRINKTISKSI